MKRFIIFLIPIVGLSLSWGASVPNEITYQGTIKEQGLPVTGDRSMLFRLTNVDGSIEYWNSGPQTITVSQGLFSKVLTITGVNWQAITPYIELSVGPKGQTPAILLPREPMTSTAYSLMSETVVDGSITTAKLADTSVTTAKLVDASVTAAKLDPALANYVIPVGMVALFTTPTCPSGWTEVVSLRGRTVFGYDPANPAQFSMGQQGGALTHNHPFNTSTNGSHDHGGVTGTGSIGGLAQTGGQLLHSYTNHTHSIASDGSHSHNGTTGSSSTLPSYTTMLYCSKL